MAIFIAVSGWMSKWKPVMSSVPQGPILGPLLFNVFISDMNRGIECTLSKTAEGTKLTTAIETPVQRVPSRGILTGLRSGPMWASWNSTRVSTRPCTWVGAIPNVSTDCGMDGLRAALQRTWGLMIELDDWKIVYDLAMCTYRPESHCGMHQKKPAVQGRSFSLLFWYPTWNYCIHIWGAETKHGPARAGVEEGHKNDRRAGTSLFRRKAERAGAV